MKIVVAGGRNKADFLIGSLLEKQHEVIVINDEESYCAYLSEKYNIPIITGNPCKRYILEEADIEDADILIALRPSDADNLTTYTISKIIEQASTIENLVNSLTLAHENIVMSELLLTKDCKVIHHKIKDLHNMPANAIICCILRKLRMIVPNGDTELLEQDKLLILSDSQTQDSVLSIFSQGVSL